MKILVCITKTPDTTAKITFTNQNTTFDASGVQFILNPYDEWYALVRAIELKERNGGTVTVINVGPSENDALIRKALAIGADDAVRIDVDPQSAMNVACQIAKYVEEENYDLIFCGKESIDYNSAEVGAMLAELLNLPFISFATKLETSNNTVTVDREIEGGTQTLSLTTPLVVSAAKGLAEQRIPNMRGIMMAKRKPLKIIPALVFEDKVVLTNYELPPSKSAVKMINPENMEELVNLLQEEAKVI